jgi:phosphatidylglycerophosphate synthase
MNIVQKYIYIFFIIILLFHKKINSVRIDDDIADTFIKNVSFLKHIHPTIITISGLLLNFYIYNLLNTPNSDIYLLGFCIIYRWLADCLDGAIARKYNKCSRLGHQLDTLSDVIMGFITFYFIQKHICNWSFNICLIIYIVFLSIFNYLFDFINTHDNLKNSKKNIIDYTVSFLINNTILIYILLIIQYSN